MADILVTGILLLLAGAAAAGLIRARRKKKGCAGCPSEGCCRQKTLEGVSCREHRKKQ